MTDKTRISTFLSEEEEMQLRIMAAKKKMSMSKYIAELIRDAMKREQEEENNG